MAGTSAVAEVTIPPIPATPVPHPRSDNDSEPENNRPHKKKKGLKDPLVTIGAMFGIMGDLWRDFQAILDEGLSVDTDNSPDSSLTYQRKKYRDLYRQLVACAPWIVDQLQTRGPSGSADIAKLLEEGRQSGRAVHLHGIKKSIVTWNHFNPPILPDDKHSRGFEHNDCGRLLCPASYDWSDPVVRAAIRNHSPEFPVGAKDFAIVLWANEEVNKDSLMEGFLRNSRLVMALRYCLLGPRAAVGGYRVAARKPRARVYRVRAVTVGAIAYAAVLVHFALTAQESMSAGGTGGKFPYEAFYQAVVRYIELHMTEAQRKDLLAWWTAQIFGSIYDEDNDSEDDENNSSPTPRRRHMSVMDCMKAQSLAITQTSATSSESSPALHDRVNRA